MNGITYRKMLENKLELHITIYECDMFTQDRAPCHRSRLVSDFLKKKNMKALDWPGNSTDHNSIENLWAILKDDGR